MSQRVSACLTVTQAPSASRVLEACQGQVLGCAWRGGGQSGLAASPFAFMLHHFHNRHIFIQYLCKKLCMTVQPGSV